ITYQWQYNGVDIASANTSTYSIPEVKGNEDGTYRVVITNLYGVAQSRQAVFKSIFPPAITLQPTDSNTTTGANIAFTVNANSIVPLIYQWRKNGINLNGATSSTLTLNNVQGDDNGTYNVVVSNLAGDVTSQDAKLSVALPVTLAQFNNSLVGHWQFTGNANDMSGRGNHGTILGGAEFDTDRYGTAGQALKLNGVDNYARITSMTDFNFDANTSFTLSGWVKPTDINATSWLMSNRNGNNQPYYQFGFRDNKLTTRSSTLLANDNTSDLQIPSVLNWNGANNW
ncbi:uncharacterized protein METZ01_LOCUS399104, partial [marine metagenome]